MRAILVLVLGGALLAGCKHPDSAKASGSREKSSKAPAEKASKTGTPREPSPVPVKAMTAINEPAGKVASVNTGLRFVVIDFGLNTVPQPEQRLSVYRQAQKVGELKVSSQARNSIVAADITAGEAQIGDEVRPEH